MGQPIQVKRQASDLHDYQKVAIQHTVRHDYAMLWLDVGLGKTVIGLTSILDRLDALVSFGTIMVGPKRVCSMVWEKEAMEWAHTRGLTFSLVRGTPKARHYALRKKADIHLVNYENLQWLVDEIIAIWLSRGEYPPWQTLLFDEVDKLKDSTGKRSMALQRIIPYFRYRIGMTGTPAAEGYKDLFGQYLVIDGGARLGTNYTDYLNKYFIKDGYKHHLRAGAEEEIKALVADITLCMTAGEYLPNQTPPIINDIYIDLPPDVREKYDRLERDMFLQLDNSGVDVNVEVFNEASLLNKCLQAANGQPYVMPNSTEWAPLHDEKLKVLDDIVSESNGQPILVGYEFIADKERIMERYPQAEYIGGHMTAAQEQDLQARWDAGQIPILVGHPASMGHGLNLQYGGHIGVWFGLTWPLRLYIQFIGRLARQGQKQVPIFHRILARNTADEIQAASLVEKDGIQTDLKATINNYRHDRGV